MKNELVDALPMLRAFARSLSGNRDRADDLVQETVMRALANKDKFQAGTNLHAWLVTILRNQYYSEGRKRRREVEDSEGAHAARLADIGGQHGHLELDDFLRAMQLLPDEQREALVLIGASGFSYEEAADICEVKVGTVKSRVSRARARLEEIMSGGVPLPPAETAKRSADEIQQAMALRTG
ncbi:sigma-70 family RNA polymerase sigma factor [Kaistia nematophila]|uniref:RNA polymerase sigma factor n=1 Tax=Kaistia nematophila TaxID=2994654 RepID=A0A9X3DZF6_9HYPH|nr:sigma-70 family RNA polymerase sigma factor [Kaistia nematophila]MBN9027796.1 sigma-70 family RNA polymerase sigma factor [Hyphomicrobiales bacterium]MCX5568261.1 sigma-70 family RNA polymerase sigma factor [Kaistia nematophila]